MHKKNKVIIAGVAIGIVVLGVGSFFVFRTFNVNKAVTKGLDLISEKNYAKAIISLELALDSKPSNKQALESKAMIEKYLDSKKLFDEGKIEEANKEVNEINENYSNIEGFKEDVDNLKSQIDEFIKKDAKINDDIIKVRQFVNDKNYDEAKNILDQLDKEKSSETQKQQIYDITAIINAELSRIEAEKKAQEEAKKKEVIESEKNNNAIQLSEVVDYVSKYKKSDETINSVVG
ncbi:MAG: hypothetical protein ACRDA5_14855, partial [Clostridium sp.]